MKYLSLAIIISNLLLWSCGGNEESHESKKNENQTESTSNASPPAAANSTDAMNDIGVGPVKSVTLDENINVDMAAKGKEIYEAKCRSCHKPDAKFIGPAPKDILSRRNPVWVMNMIVNPEGMLKEDSIAIRLQKEANGAPMANQNVTEEQAREILEYFRTL